MSLNQINEDFNDVFETFFPKMNPVKGRFLGYVNRFVRKALSWRRNFFKGKIFISERIVEYPVILRWLRSQGKVLDIGCVSSRLPMQLASMGYEVYGIDVRDYPLHHPNFHFQKTDLFLWKPDKKFDAIILLSALEHFGLGAYGDMKEEDADKKAIQLITQWLNPHGQLLVSVPFGKYGITKKHRVYDLSRLQNTFSNFEWVKEAYFIRNNDHWSPCAKEALKNMESPSLPPNGVAILDLKLKG